MTYAVEFVHSKRLVTSATTPLPPIPRCTHKFNALTPKQNFLYICTTQDQKQLPHPYLQVLVFNASLEFLAIYSFDRCWFCQYKLNSKDNVSHATENSVSFRTKNHSMECLEGKINYWEIIAIWIHLPSAYKYLKV